MPLLADYAITPDVFDIASYSSDEICGLHLRTIGQVIREEGLVRDLRAGEWRELFANRDRMWHVGAKEILKQLVVRCRLIEVPPARPAAPNQDPEWCAEALVAHQHHPMTGGVIVTEKIKERYRLKPLVEQIDELCKAWWWKQRSPSVRLDRKFADYREQLCLVLHHANLLQFIDPHLNPRRTGYGEFAQLLAEAGTRTPAPRIEIHRVCYEGSGPGRRIVPCREIRQMFRDELASPLRAAGLTAEVFVWDDFHDRFLLSNLIGISLPNGFDTTRKRDDRTTWTRLGYAQYEDLQREFDPASQRHDLRARFTLP